MDFTFKKGQEQKKDTLLKKTSSVLSSPEKKKVYFKTLLPVVIGVAVGITGAKIFGVVANPYVVDGISMEPTLKNKQILITKEVTTDVDIERGDIVVVDVNGLGEEYSGDYLKRVVGLPGDTLQIHDGKLIINGKVSEEYQFEDIVDPGCLKSPLTLGIDQYMVLGDNRNYSVDGRVFGPIPKKRIINVVKKKLF